MSQPQGAGDTMKQGDGAEEACLSCAGRTLTCRPVLDETISMVRGLNEDFEPGLQFHWHCCDLCRVAWLAGISRDDDLTRADSERNDRALRNYKVWETDPLPLAH